MWLAIAIGFLLSFAGGLCAGLLFRKDQQPGGVSPTPSELSEIVDIVQISMRLGKRKDEIVRQIDEMLKGK